jgi:alkylhydroperoxidase family enzyme
MARVPYLTPDDLAPEQRDLLARPIALARALANAPGAARAFHGLGHWIRHASGLDPRLRELAILQVGYLARSPYEWSHHVKIGFDFGVTEADVRALMAESQGRANSLEPLARTVLRGVREIAIDGGMQAPTFGELEAALGREHTIELVIVAAFYAAVVRVLASLAIDVEPDYQPYLDKFPLPVAAD